jgi:signal peptidase I
VTYEDKIAYSNLAPLPIYGGKNVNRLSIELGDKYKYKTSTLTVNVTYRGDERINQKTKLVCALYEDATFSDPSYKVKTYDGTSSVSSSAASSGSSKSASASASASSKTSSAPSSCTYSFSFSGLFEEKVYLLTWVDFNGPDGEETYDKGEPFVIYKDTDMKKEAEGLTFTADDRTSERFINIEFDDEFDEMD